MAANRSVQQARTGWIIVLGCVIVLAVVSLVVTYGRSNSVSGTVHAGGMEHVRLGARDRHV